MPLIERDLRDISATEGTYLEQERVHYYYVLDKNHLFTEPAVIIEDQGQSYLVDGHHRTYAHYLRNKRSVPLLKLVTDEEVQQCQQGRAKEHYTFQSLLQACKRGHTESLEIGIERIADYSLLQHKPTEWDTLPQVKILSLNPTLDICNSINSKVVGGKGFNVARNMIKLGYENVCVYTLAGGKTGGLLAQIADRENIPAAVIPILDETLEVLLTGSIKERSHPLNPKVRMQEWLNLEQQLERGMEKGNWLWLGGSLPRNLSSSTFNNLIKKYTNMSEIIFDSSEAEPFRLALDAGPDIIKPNRREILTYLGKDTESEILNPIEIASICLGLIEQKKATIILASLDKDGALLVTKDHAYHAEALEGAVKCTIGAGDAFLAGYLVSRLKGEETIENLKKAVATAYSNITREGNLGADKKQVELLSPLVKVKII